ncbi:MAG: hypothetical protein GY861_13915 [bacterium]|nr:hypothetical protein [bacterium]
MAKKRCREYYYECIKAFPAYNIGDELRDDSDEYSPSFYPEDYPKYFKKKYRYITYDTNAKPSDIIREDISSILTRISPSATPLFDFSAKGNHDTLYRWKGES